MSDNSRVFITDKEVCSIAEISQSTLTRLMGGFHRGKRRAGCEVDLREAKPVLVGGYRRWRIDAVANILGISVEELTRRIS